MKKPKIEKILLVLCLILAWSFAGAKEDPKNDKRVAKTSIQRSHTYFLINNVFTQFANTMESDVELTSGQNSGFEWPKGSGKTASYESGFVYAGFYEGKATPASNPAHRKFVNGSVYISGMTEGWITTPGTGVEPPDAKYITPSDPLARCFRVRPDINPYNTQTTAEELVAKVEQEEVALIDRFSSLTAQQIYDQYVKDWNEWPATQGAPFKDVNGNGTYEPATDIPGVPGADQTIWFVCNDMVAAQSQTLAGALAQGVEVQKTIWGYNRQSALGNVYFAKWTLINKSGALIDTMYNCFWTDIDLGFAGDDFAGVDVARQLGYNYNGKGFDQVYGEACPASGYAFLQGPLVPGIASDSGIFKGAYRHGFKNLKMSAFDPFINGGGNYGDPPQGNSTAARDQWWNLLTGHIGVTGGPWINPTNGDTTSFVFDGDPVTGQGWLDGSFAPPGDRRFCETAGPFSLAPGDTQEIVVGGMVGQGADRLSGITAIRATCDEAQAAYNNFFVLPQSAPNPTVVITPLDGAIMLSWGDPAKVKQIEVDYNADPASKGYKFEAYRVYQLQTQSFTNPKVVGTFDIATDPVLDNNGVSHYMQITNDAFTSKVLNNGSPYYFGVSTIAYNPAGFPILLEQAPSVFQVIPQQPKLGTQLANTALDVIKGTRLTGTGDATVSAKVIDPTKTVTGNYVVTFDVIAGNSEWSVTRDGTAIPTWTGVTTKGTVTGDLPIIDGLQLNTTGWSFSAATAIASFVNKPKPGSALNLNVQGTLLNATSFWWSNCGRPDLAARLCTPAISQWDLELRFTGVTVVPTNPDTSVASGGQWTTYYCRGANGSLVPLTKNHINIISPFELWDIENNVQIQYAVVDRNRVGGTPGPAWWGDAGNWTAAKPPYFRMAGREYIIPIYKPYNAASAQTTTFDPTDSLATWMFWFEAQDDANPSSWVTGDVAQVKIPNPLAHGDTYGFSTTAATVGSKTLAKTQASQINVFPNPYFGFQPLEQNRYQRFVTFNHLPQKATIRIFTLAGQLVRSYAKDDPSQFFAWDLKNSVGIPVASGVYVVHVDMPDIGTSRILKLSVIQPQQVLDHL